MSALTCNFDDGDGDYEWYYDTPNDFTTLDTKRSRKCCSCGERIAVGAQVLRFFCSHPVRNDIEERIYGDEVPMASKYMCESCGDRALNLAELGYCTPPGDDMRKLVRQYAQMHKSGTL